MAGFLEELKKRRVVRTAVIYSGGAFAVLQAAELFVDAFSLPDAVFSVIAIACVLGLPAALVMSWAFDVSSEGPTESAASPSWLSGKTIAAGATLLGLGVLLGLAPQYFSKSDPAQPDTTVRRYEIALPENAPVEFIGSSPLRTPVRALAITPDGNSLVYAGPSDTDVSQLFIRRLDEFGAQPIPGTKGAYRPFISPDGKTLAFFAYDELRVVPLDGGSVRTIVAVANPRGGVWLGNERIMYEDREGIQGWVVDINTTNLRPEPFTEPTTADGSTITLISEMFPAPGGKGLITTAFPPDERSPALVVYDPDSHEINELIQLPVFGQAVSDTLVYVVGNDLLAVDYDAENRSVSGETRTVGTELRRDEILPQFVLSEKTLIYATGTPYLRRQIARITSEWTVEDTPIEDARHGGLSMSPDGSELAATLMGTNLDVWIYSLADGQGRRLTRGGDNHHPMWSDDGDTVFFMHENSDLTTGMYSTSASAASFEKTFVLDTQSFVDEVHPGDLAMLRIFREQPQQDYALVDLTTGEMTMVGNRPDVHEDLGNLSPDGKWVALTVDASGRFEVIVVPASGEEGAIRVSSEGGEEPRWSADMSVLYFRYGTRMFRSRIDEQNGKLSFSRPEVVFEDSQWINIGGYSYWPDRTEGGFLILRENQLPYATSLRVVEGWRNIRQAM